MNISTLRTHGAAPVRRLQSLARQHGPALALSLIVIAIAYNLAIITWQAVPAHAPGTPPPAMQPSPSRARPSSANAGAGLADMHLFGTANPAQTPSSAAIDAPETQLNLTLRGILASDDGVQSRAIIAAGGGRGAEKIYKVGSRIPGGAVVHAIYSDRVILERGGHLEALRLPKEKSGQSITRSPRQRTLPTGVRGTSRASASAVQQLRNTLASHPDKLTDYVKALPATGRDGKQIGYRVFPGRDAAFFGRLGLQPGDIVTAVNGIPLNDPSKSLQVLKQLKGSGNLNLTIQRGGQSRTVALPQR